VKRRLRAIALFLLLGLIVTCCVAVWLAMSVDLTTGASASAMRRDWSVTAQWARGSLRVTSQRIKPSWCPTQAAGAPNTPGAGDYPTAWAAATSNGSPEWLEVEYDQPRVPAFIDIYESYNPGAVTRLTLIDENGREIEVWVGDEALPPGSAANVSRIKINGPVPAVKRVKIYQGRPDVPGWNEIDAVALVDDQGKTHWASDATASSWYGQASYAPQSGTPRKPADLIPSWSDLPKGAADALAPADVDQRAVEAYGWPMLALWAPTDYNAKTPTISGISLSGFTPRVAAPAAQQNVMPYQPIAVGLLVDSLIYGAALAVVWIVLVWPRRFIVEVARLKRGCCVRCGYDLGYDFPRGCPECGWRRVPSSES
jgi:hypothetical protein